MSAEPLHFFTLDEYFALEHVGDARYEYWDGEILCMSGGGSKEHSRIAGNIHFLLKLALRGARCEAFTAEQPIFTPKYPPYRYPDASLVCGEAQFEKLRGIDTLINPTLIVEVISPSSESRDKGPKWQLYQGLESLQEYLLIAQDQPQIIHYIKQADGKWSAETINGLHSSISLVVLDSTLKLTDIYENVLSEN